MQVNITHNNINYITDLRKPIDISVPIKPNGVNAWGEAKMKISPVENGRWVGDVKAGAAINFNNIFFNPHAHTTHTECLGHITEEKQILNNELSTFFFISKLITLSPNKKNKDYIITKNMLSSVVTKTTDIDALIIRTLPNEEGKMCKNYTKTNPPYLTKEAAEYIAEIDIQHLLIDTPSVDKEEDGGALHAHKSFWGIPKKPRFGCTITELIYVSNAIKDDIYLLNLQFVPFLNDASPSRPVLFKLEKNN